MKPAPSVTNVVSGPVYDLQQFQKLKQELNPQAKDLEQGDRLFDPGIAQYRLV